jgi:hypothetical protein
MVGHLTAADIEKVVRELASHAQKDLEIMSLFGAGMTLQNGIWAPPAKDMAVDYLNSLSYPLLQWGYATPRKAPPPPKPATASPLWEHPDTVTEEIVAYRGWSYDFGIQEDGSIEVWLESLYQDFYWKGPVTTASQPPAADNDLGLYAVGGQPHHEGNWNYYVEDAESVQVWGRVALSGVVVEGKNGYRAERATIQELWVNPRDPRTEDNLDGVCKALADRYQCDVSVKTPEWADIRTSA